MEIGHTGRDLLEKMILFDFFQNIRHAYVTLPTLIDCRAQAAQLFAVLVVFVKSFLHTSLSSWPPVFKAPQSRENSFLIKAIHL